MQTKKKKSGYTAYTCTTPLGGGNDETKTKIKTSSQSPFANENQVMRGLFWPIYGWNHLNIPSDRNHMTPI